MEVLLDAEAAQEHGGIALGIPALHLGELVLELGDAVAVLVVEVRLGIEGVLLLHDGPEDAVPHQHRIHDGVLVEGIVVLAQYREALAGAEGDAPTRRLEGAADGA